MVCMGDLERQIVLGRQDLTYRRTGSPQVISSRVPRHPAYGFDSAVLRPRGMASRVCSAPTRRPCRHMVAHKMKNGVSGRGSWMKKHGNPLPRRGSPRPGLWIAGVFTERRIHPARPQALRGCGLRATTMRASARPLQKIPVGIVIGVRRFNGAEVSQCL